MKIIHNIFCYFSYFLLMTCKYLLKRVFAIDKLEIRKIKRIKKTCLTI